MNMKGKGAEQVRQRPMMLAHHTTRLNTLDTVVSDPARFNVSVKNFPSALRFPDTFQVTPLEVAVRVNEMLDFEATLKTLSSYLFFRGDGRDSSLGFAEPANPV